MKCYVSFGLFLSITVTVQSQCEYFSFVFVGSLFTSCIIIVTVTWQGETVTDPLVIYHSEIQQNVTNNSLTCSHTSGPVAWYLAIMNVRLVTHSPGTFINVITNGGRQAQIWRGTHDGRDESRFDGLWTCRLNGTTGAGAFHVGIYDDTPPTGKLFPC